MKYSDFIKIGYRLQKQAARPKAVPTILPPPGVPQSGGVQSGGSSSDGNFNSEGQVVEQWPSGSPDPAQPSWQGFNAPEPVTPWDEQAEQGAGDEQSGPVGGFYSPQALHNAPYLAPPDSYHIPWSPLEAGGKSIWYGTMAPDAVRGLTPASKTKTWLDYWNGLKKQNFPPYQPPKPWNGWSSAGKVVSGPFSTFIGATTLADAPNKAHKMWYANDPVTRAGYGASAVADVGLGAHALARGGATLFPGTAAKAAARLSCLRYLLRVNPGLGWAFAGALDLGLGTQEWMNKGLAYNEAQNEYLRRLEAQNSALFHGNPLQMSRRGGYVPSEPILSQNPEAEQRVIKAENYVAKNPHGPAEHTGGALGMVGSALNYLENKPLTVRNVFNASPVGGLWNAACGLVAPGWAVRGDSPAGGDFAVYISRQHAAELNQNLPARIDRPSNDEVDDRPVVERGGQIIPEAMVENDAYRRILPTQDPNQAYGWFVNPFMAPALVPSNDLEEYMIREDPEERERIERCKELERKYTPERAALCGSVYE